MESKFLKHQNVIHAKIYMTNKGIKGGLKIANLL